VCTGKKLHVQAHESHETNEGRKAAERRGEERGTRRKKKGGGEGEKNETGK
jgi:hypothetical protein